MALDMHRDGLKKKCSGNHLKISEEAYSMEDIITPEYPLDPLEVIGERSFNQPREIPVEEIGSPVQEFYRDATILLTGGTGFMGKVLLEKLLRSCPHIKHIYLLVRHKKGKKPHERIDGIFQDRMFKRLKYEVPKFYHKVSTIHGDLTLKNLGLSTDDRKKLTEEVNVILHGAATVRFDERIDIAIRINVLGTREIIKLAKDTSNLKVVMYVSTAFSNCARIEIEEKIYDMPFNYNDVINKVLAIEDVEELERITPQIILNWPNSYTFTKALAESLVKTEAQGLPFGILRPAVIISTYKEPVRGWIDNVYGPIGVIVGIGTGILHTYELKLDVKTDVVPVDLVVNSLICAAVQTGKQADVTNNNTENGIPIYTYSSGPQNPTTWRNMLELSEKYGIYWPTIRAIWYYSLITTGNPTLFVILNFFLHTVPGYILDYLAVLTGQEPMLTKIYTKMDNVRDTLRYFASREFVFKNDNTQKLWSRLSDKDKELFFFDISQMSWDVYYRALCIGLRVYLVNDDINTLPLARKKWNRLYYAHCTLRAVFYLAVVYIVWLFFGLVYSLFN